MKKSMLLPIVFLILSTTCSYAQKVVQINFSNQSTCDVYVEIISVHDSCGVGTPISDLETISGSSTPTFYPLSGYVVIEVWILDSYGGNVMETVDFCAPSLITGTFNNGCDDMYGFASGNCCGANPDIRDIGLSVL